MFSIDRDLVVQLTRDLIRFPSVNPPGNEGEIAAFLHARMKDVGMEAKIQPIAEKRANVIGRIPGSGSGHVVLTGHVDVVPPGEQPWTHAPFEGESVDGRIYGRGSADMKGGVAAMVAAAAALVHMDFRPSADLIIAATAGEEAGLVGAKYMVRERSLAGSRYLVVGEPTDLDVFVAEKGVLWIDVRAYGRTAHGSMPWLGVNAVSYMARLIPRLEAYPFPYEESGLLGKPSLSVNLVHGGNKTNVVPDSCRISIDMRTVPSQRHPDLIASVRTLAEEVAREFSDDLRIEMDVDQDEGPVETAQSDPLVEATVQSVHAVRGELPSIRGVTYGTDAAVLGPGFDVSMVICGPGAPGMAHQPDEYVEAEQVYQAAQIYADLAIRLLN